MTNLFVVSGVGDTNLALSTIRSIEGRSSQEKIVIISLTKAAQQIVESFSSTLLMDKKTLPEILELSPEQFLEHCDSRQLQSVVEYIRSQRISHAYFGIPSVNNKIPFQVAQELDIPVLMAYEFMFHPEVHCLWEYLPQLKSKPNLQWAVPLAAAVEDFGGGVITHIVGHMSIDNAYSAKSLGSKTPGEVRESLQVSQTQSLAFVSSTTQPVEIDVAFLGALFTELPKHPDVHVRLGLHPGIQDLDTYLEKILSVFAKYSGIDQQFKIILPSRLVSRFKSPELSIDHPKFQAVFLRVDIDGSEASSAADRVAQAVPGALLNQAVLEGKPAFASSGRPYLPYGYFSRSIAAFFSEKRQPLRNKEDLGLDKKTAGERCAEILLAM